MTNLRAQILVREPCKSLLLIGKDPRKPLTGAVYFEAGGGMLKKHRQLIVPRLRSTRQKLLRRCVVRNFANDRDEHRMLAGRNPFVRRTKKVGEDEGCVTRMSRARKL